MHRLWVDHVVWTRMLILAALSGNRQEQKVVWDRLMQNQVDIGKAFGSSKLIALLQRHIVAAYVVVSDLAAQDPKTEEDLAEWKGNATRIADELSKLTGLEVGSLDAMMQEHLTLTANEAKARIATQDAKSVVDVRKDYAADVKAFDAVLSQIIKMSKALSAARSQRTLQANRQNRGK